MSHTFSFQWIWWGLSLWNVDYAMDVEWNILAVCWPMLIAEAIYEFSIVLSRERVVSIGNRSLVRFITSTWIRDLSEVSIATPSFLRMINHTQKSTSRFPALPNSLSPTWNVTVILSSLWSCSWKHSLPCAASWMLCARAAPIRVLAARRIEDVENRMVEEFVLIADGPNRIDWRNVTADWISFVCREMPDLELSRKGEP